jgi:hypothetical protein
MSTLAIWKYDLTGPNAVYANDTPDGGALVAKVMAPAPARFLDVDFQARDQTMVLVAWALVPIDAADEPVYLRIVTTGENLSDDFLGESDAASHVGTATDPWSGTVVHVWRQEKPGG